MSFRHQRVEELIKRNVDTILLKEMELPKDVVITITHVKANEKLSDADVFVSVIPDNQTKDALAFLARNVYNIQQQINKKMQMRPVPKIRFVEDKIPAQAAHIEKILNEIKKQDKK